MKNKLIITYLIGVALCSFFIGHFNKIGICIYVILTLVALIFLWKDGLDFCKKLDDAASGEKTTEAEF